MGNWSQKHLSTNAIQKVFTVAYFSHYMIKGQYLANMLNQLHHMKPQMVHG